MQLRHLRLDIFFTFSDGLQHKGCPHKFENFWDPPTLSRPVHFCLTTIPPCPFGHKAGIIWKIATFHTLNNSHWRVKKLIILFENNAKNIRMKTIFEMMSLHCVRYILYLIQAGRKFNIQTYCQIIRVNFTYMVATFFSKRTSTFG